MRKSRVVRPPHAETREPPLAVLRVAETRSGDRYWQLVAVCVILRRCQSTSPTLRLLTNMKTLYD